MTARMTLKGLADILRQEKYWLVGIIGNSMTLTKSRNNNPVMVNIAYIKGAFSISFPSYLFNSKISHFTPSSSEMRYCRNKTVIYSLIHTLKRSRVWNYIENKNFIKVNDYNVKSDKRGLEKQLQELLHDASSSEVEQ